MPAKPFSFTDAIQQQNEFLTREVEALRSENRQLVREIAKLQNEIFQLKHPLPSRRRSVAKGGA